MNERVIFDRLRVFVSSSMDELAKERAAVREALGQLKIDAWVFEVDAGAQSRSPQQTFHDEISRADLYLGIFWKQLGEFTRDEYETAQKLKKDSLIYEKRVDLTRRNPELESFLQTVGDVKVGKTIKYFETAEELGEQVQYDLARWQTNTIRDRTYQIHEPGQLSDDRRAVRVLEGKTRQFWLEGVLQSSIRGVRGLQPDVASRPDAVFNPWEEILEVPDQDPRKIEPNSSRREIFENLGRSLLILGAPGAGKTTTLLQLTEEILGPDSRYAHHSTPLVLNLSTWGETGKSLADWLTDEMLSKYQLPARIGRRLLEDHRLHLMLDGLDEVPAERRASCVDAINEFAETVGVPGIVVTCRIDEYATLPRRLKMAGAICLQTLTEEQSRTYLIEAGLPSLADGLREDRALQELARSPLMLNTMAVAYEDQPIATRAANSVESWRTHIFDLYIKKMFSRAVSRTHRFSKDVVLHTLHTIASDMLQRTRTAILIEELQPSMLPSTASRISYLLFSRTAGALAFSMLLGVSIALGFWNEPGGSPPLGEIFGDILPIALIAAMLFGPLLAATDTAVFSFRSRKRQTVRIWRYLGALTPGVLYALAAVIAVNLVDASDEDVLGPMFFVLGGGAAALVWGRRWPQHSFTRDILSVEYLNWSWRKVPLGAGLGLVVGLSIASLMLFSMGPLTGSEAALIPQISILAALTAAFLGAVLSGIRTDVTEKKTRPNQGMRLSARNAAFGLLGGTVLVGSAFVIFFIVATVTAGILHPGGVPSPSELEFSEVVPVVASMSVAAGLFFGACASLWYGGLDLIYHFVLRLSLRKNQQIPLRLALLLDQASELILLRKVGGGYMFIHRYLLEHFCAPESWDAK